MEFRKLNNALEVFEKEMKSQGLWDNLALMVTSDFGRTLTVSPNMFCLAKSHGSFGHL